METAISRRAVGLAALAIGCAGCGGSGHSSSGSAASPTPPAGHTSSGAVPSGGPSATGPFAWLRPRAAPAGWRVARISAGSEMPYPPNWRQIKGDRGTATAALRNADGRYFGYLNVTPRQGPETLADWRTFRIDHNHNEGDRSVTRLAFASGLRFLTGHGSCVKDAYVSGTGVHYVEIACLVAGTHAQSVIVGAAPPSSWAQAAGIIERSISGFRA
jgi:hypothetical protein